MFQPVPVFVGLRYSLAREHSFFVSFITWVSLLGVAVGVARADHRAVGHERLRDRIAHPAPQPLGARELSADGAAMPDWRERIRALAGRAGTRRRGAVPRYRCDAEPCSDMSGAIVRGIDPALENERVGDRALDARRQALEPEAGIARHHSRADARVPAAGRRRRHRDRHGSERRCREQRRGHGTRAAAAAIPGGRHFRGRAAGTRQRARARRLEGRRGIARSQGAHRHSPEVRRRAAGARASHTRRCA